MSAPRANAARESAAQTIAALGYQLAAAARDAADPAVRARLHELRALAGVALAELCTLSTNSPAAPHARAMDLIRVLLTDDHAVVRAGLKAVLSAAKDIEVVGEAANGREALDAAERLRPDVVVMDLTMPEVDGLAATKELAARAPASRVLVLTMHAEEEFLVPLLEAGAAGYLGKHAADRELVAAVRAVAHGDTSVQPSAARALARGLRERGAHTDDRARYEQLTERERDVLRLVARGYSAPEIGEQIHISPKTVDTYKQRIGEKLGITHRAAYVQFALKLGLLQD